MISIVAMYNNPALFKPKNRFLFTKGDDGFFVVGGVCEACEICEACEACEACEGICVLR